MRKLAKVTELHAQRMTPNQIAEAQRLAREWRPKTWEEPQQAGVDRRQDLSTAFQRTIGSETIYHQVPPEKEEATRPILDA